MKTKQCIVCGITFNKPVNRSRKDWEKARYCSKTCMHKHCHKGVKSPSHFKKGFKPWNKGIEYEAIKGDKHPQWKGGRLKRPNGYIEILKPEHPYCNSLGYVKEHRFLMEKKLGRILEKCEVVHHLNKIKDDNRIENLMLFSSNGEHTHYHALN